ncbi:MAG: RdgB/HAM1 family non-canonical purine NTP pyrophosphatase [Oceanipulchritudo sp.]
MKKGCELNVYLASGNPHKLEEFKFLMETGNRALKLYPPAAAGGMPEVEETGEHFLENAVLKAEALAGTAPPGAWVLADDSGLEVDALGGAPGVRSARYASEAGDAGANNRKLLRELEGVPEEKRTARFVCVLVLLSVQGERHSFEGRCEGTIVDRAAGTEGFGYDPLFRPRGYDRTFAELGSEIKNRLSHRSQALDRLNAFLGNARFSP